MRLSSSNYRLLPVYNILKDQHRFYCGDACDEVLRVYDSAYPPFELIFDEDMGIPSSVRLIKVCGEGTYVTNWANSVMIEEKDIDQDEVTEWVYKFGGGSFNGVPAGVYYVEVIYPDGTKHFTETFAHPGDCTPLPIYGLSPSQPSTCLPYWYLEYSHSCDEKSLGDYSSGFENKLWLGEIILVRDGSIENTVSRKDGFGVETIIATDIRPKWTFEILGTSWLLDSLEFLKLYDQVYLKRSDNGDVFQLQNIEVAIKGSSEDCFFPIKLTFTKDALVNTKCCDSVYEQAPVPANCAGMHAITSADFQICAGDDGELTVTVIGGAMPFVYVWSDGQIGQTITVSPDETTIYTVTVIDAFGCVKQDTVTITVIVCDGEFLVDIVASEDVICEGESTDLDATVTGGVGPFTYLWSTGATTQDITVSPAATTMYSLQVTDTDDGTIVMAYITITVNQAPNPTIQRNGCFMSLAQIEACETISYQWQVEGPPDTWSAAPGTNNGTTYTGINGSTYRLRVICNGCTGYSNELTTVCSGECSVEITSVTYDDVLDELSISYVSTFTGSTFITGFIDVFEHNSFTPVPADCNDSIWEYVISLTLTAGSGTFVIPFVPAWLPTCLRINIDINSGLCETLGIFPIS